MTAYGSRGASWCKCVGIDDETRRISIHGQGLKRVDEDSG